MIPIARREAILASVKQAPFVTIAQLAQDLDVSQMTIRRDLVKLEEEGLVVQISGGVKSSQRLHFEPSHDEKSLLKSQEKNLIGQKAAEFVPQNSCIYLDAGTTTLAMCKYLFGRGDLTIVTNDLVVAQQLSTKSENNIIMVGGMIRASNQSTVGHLASKTLEALSIDVAFISASSFDVRGITTPDPDKVIVKHKVAEIAQKRILLSDSSKYGQIATFIAVPIDMLNQIICDHQLSEQAQKSLLKTGVDLILV